jgi:hypothetical protein
MVVRHQSLVNFRDIEIGIAAFVMCSYYWSFCSGTAYNYITLKRHLQTGKSQCFANPCVLLRLADEKWRIY